VPPGWTSNHRGREAVWTNDATGRQVSGAAGGQNAMHIFAMAIG
jgi:hypothetical protein